MGEESQGGFDGDRNQEEQVLRHHQHREFGEAWRTQHGRRSRKFQCDALSQYQGLRCPADEGTSVIHLKISSFNFSQFFLELLLLRKTKKILKIWSCFQENTALLKLVGERKYVCSLKIDCLVLFGVIRSGSWFQSGLFGNLIDFVLPLVRQ